MSADPKFPYFFGGGFRGLFYVMGYSRVFKSPLFWISIASSVIIVAFCISCEINTLNVLMGVVEKVLNIFPSFIGFALAAYTIVVGSGSAVLVDGTMLKASEKRFSLYQTTNSVWGFILLINVLALVISFVFSVVNLVSKNIESTFSGGFCNIVNLFGLFIISFISIYSFLLQIRMVRLIFELGQKTFYFYSKPKMTKEENESAITKLGKTTPK